ncbi:protein kinase domain-containing protein [Actinomadura rubrisoli]|uniref:Serine/threonine protein kinase n=1 Tax=Actinomadura rubrisoli TaxID=2530368 RepID=A0A4R5A7C7_9ACTN|nr:serine/threonine-protein kinase [Actinomadura rubrisoli]TDD68048.1 serine/threonine protein kinase [Actinomadura rubrisoli]
MGDVDGTETGGGTPPRETRRDPGVTRRDPRVPGPRPAPPEPPGPPGPGATRRDGEAPGDPLMRLPAALAERYETVAELPVQGAESDLLLVRPREGAGSGTGGRAADEEYVAKIFRRGYHADREVWAKLPALDSPHVLRILETGHADGRDYEVTQYAPDGNLRALMAGPLPADAVADIAAQLAEGLTALHQAGIVHRDLKPENVLVLGTAPVRLAIADFGLSKVLDQSVVFASSSRTLAYAAPESLSGQVSPARDWWSLGMIVRELATGRAPFPGLSETVVVDHLATRPVTADDVGDPRLRLLCRGLLTRDPRRRWAGEQVADWLDGGSPRVAEEAPPSALPPGVGLPFKGRRYTDRSELARALIEEWEHAALYFFGRGESGEAWRSLRDWLAEIPDDSRIALVDGYLTTGLPPDVKLLHLVRWLDPALPPHFLGRRVTADDLPGLAALAADRRHADHRTACLLGRELWEQGLLRVLAGFEGGHELARIDDQWRAHAAAWNDLARWLRSQEAAPPGLAARLPDAGTGADGAAMRVAGGGPPVPADDPPVILLTLLALAARPSEVHRRLAEAANAARTAVYEPVPWFTWMADGAGEDPLRLLALTQAAPEAVLEIEARARDRHAAEQRDEALRAQWAERERQRLAGRNAAVTRAVLWTVPLLLLWLLGSWIVGALFGGGDDKGTSSVGGFQKSSGVPFGFLVVLSVVAWAVQCGSEVVLARAQGKDYLPDGPWSWMSRLLGAGGRGLSKASETMSGAAQRTGRRGCGTLLLAGTVPLLLILLLLAAVTPVASLLWLLLLIAGPAAHAVAAGVRLHRWRQSRTPDAGDRAIHPGGTA